MTTTKKKRRMKRCMMGFETEYGSNARLRIEALMVPVLKQAGVYHLGQFLSNGARLYQDGAHPEYSTPECDNPADLLKATLVGDEIMRRVARGKFGVFKQNVDYESHETWGAHESYASSMGGRSIRGLIPHLATRLIYTGAGGLNMIRAGGMFSMSPRASFFGKEMSESTTCNRAIINSRHEPLATNSSRIHLICGDSLCSNRAIFLKAATTAIMVRLLELGKAPQFRLGDAARFMRKLAREERGTMTVALGVQRACLKAAKSSLRQLPEWASEACVVWKGVLDEIMAGKMSSSLDWGIKKAIFARHAKSSGFGWDEVEAWNTQVVEYLDNQDGFGCEDREDAIDGDDDGDGDLRGASASLPVLRLAMAARLAAISDSWSRVNEFARLVSDLKVMDRKFGMLGDDGIFENMDKAGVLNHRVPGVSMPESLSEPPKGGRAEARGALIAGLAKRILATRGLPFETRRKCDDRGRYDVGVNWNGFSMPHEVSIESGVPTGNIVLNDVFSNEVPDRFVALRG
jgi:hypothetical protein